MSKKRGPLPPGFHLERRSGAGMWYYHTPNHEMVYHFPGRRARDEDAGVARIMRNAREACWDNYRKHKAYYDLVERVRKARIRHV